jgi:hypothetical protein
MMQLLQLQSLSGLPIISVDTISPNLIRFGGSDAELGGLTLQLAYQPVILICGAEA